MDVFPFFLFLFCQITGKGKWEYVRTFLCVCTCFWYSGVDQMIGVLLVQRVSMWWWSLVEETDCMSAKNMCMISPCTECSVLDPWGFFFWIHNHDRKCLHLYTSQGACVVALHASVEEINSVTVRQSLKQRNGLYFYEEGFAHILSFMGT